MIKELLIQIMKEFAPTTIVEKNELQEAVEILAEADFSKSHLEMLKTAYAGIKKIDPDSEAYKKMIKMLDAMSDKQIATVAKSDINFLSLLAKNRVIRRGLKKESLSEDSKYTVNHKTFSSAVQHAQAQAEKQGFEIDGDEWDRKVAMGPKKPSSGKTNRYIIDLMKNGKEVNRRLHMQVYYDEGRFELNMYIQ
jgi:hypothetical protein